MDLKETELGQTLNFRELRNQCEAIRGIIAWPGMNLGFAIVVGIDHNRHLDSHDIYLLDEFESFDMRKLGGVFFSICGRAERMCKGGCYAFETSYYFMI
jgi:hypothetical protein